MVKAKNFDGIGNTPTGVGKTRIETARGLGLKKHPHGCGEDEGAVIVGMMEAETPPRVWGRPGACGPGVCGIRNTPTGVGKTA